MTPTARTGARRCTGVLGLAGLGVVLLGAPAFALDLPSAPPVLETAAAALPAPVATLLPAPVASLIPSPVASALDPVTSKVPDASPSAKPTPTPAPAPKAQAEQPAPAPAPAMRQQARSVSGVAPLPATFAFSAGRAEMHELAGVVAPVAVAPVPVTPQLAPAAVAAPAALPGTNSPAGLPALVVALAIGAVSAVAAGQVAEMHARRTATT